MTTTAPVNAPEQGTSDIRDAGHVDVVVVGAGVSGIGAAHHLQERFPNRTFVILEAQDNRGGTWWTNRFPGIRSDSDLFTYGYRHKPWRGPSIAAGEEILKFMRQAVDDLGQTIVMVTHDPVAASFSDRIVFLVDGKITDDMVEPSTEKVIDKMKDLGG